FTLATRSFLIRWERFAGWPGDGGVLSPQIERVLRIAGGMVGGRVQRIEAMIFVLDLRAIRDDEANLAETTYDIVGHLRQWMQLAQRATTTGQGEVGWFFGRRGFVFEFFTSRSQS